MRNHRRQYIFEMGATLALAFSLTLSVAGGFAGAATPAAAQTAQMAGIAQMAVGRIKAVTGSVTLERDGASRPAVVGDDVRIGDILRSGDDGACGMTFDDNSRVSIGPNAEYELLEYRHSGGSDDAFVSNLHEGSLSAVSGDIVKKRPGAMKVRTPAGALAVRGTDFAVRVKN